MSLVLDVDDLLGETEAPSRLFPLISARKPTVLIATHGRATRNALSVILQSAGYRTLVAVDAFAAAECLNGSATIDLAFIDWRLPGVKGLGLQVCRTMKQCDRTNVPVVLISRENNWWTRLRSRKAGAIGVLVKPIHTNDVQTLLAKWLPIER